jgi:hypothetical protein
MGTGTAWTAEEDVTLAWCWLNVSTDPVVGRNQQMSKFWSRIFDLFVAEMKKKGGTSAERTTTACQNRWSMVNRDLNKFVGVVSQLSATPKSGWSAEMYQTEALKVYQDEQGGPFRYIAVYDLLKNEPKWKDQRGYARDEKCLAAAVKKKKKVKASSPLEDTSNIINVSSTIDEEDEEEVRPAGNKQAKKQAYEEKKGKYSQLEIERLQAEASAAKAAAMNRRANAFTDELTLKVIALNPDSEFAKRWMANFMEEQCYLQEKRKADAKLLEESSKVAEKEKAKKVKRASATALVSASSCEEQPQEDDNDIITPQPSRPVNSFTVPLPPFENFEATSSFSSVSTRGTTHSSSSG